MTAARSRSRASAKAAGSRFERAIADYLAEHVDDRIDRRVKNGAKDPTQLGPHHDEAEVERGNDDAIVALLIHKRRGVSDPGKQWVTCTVDDLVALLVGQRPITEPTEESA